MLSLLRRISFQRHCEGVYLVGEPTRIQLFIVQAADGFDLRSRTLIWPSVHNDLFTIVCLATDHFMACSFLVGLNKIYCGGNCT